MPRDAAGNKVGRRELREASEDLADSRPGVRGGIVRTDGTEATFVQTVRGPVKVGDTRQT